MPDPKTMTESAIDFAYQNEVAKLLDVFFQGASVNDANASAKFMNSLQLLQGVRNGCIEMAKQLQSP